MAREELGLLLQLAGEPDIVGVQKGDVLARRMGVAEIARGADPVSPTVGMAQVGDATAFVSGVVGGDLRASVGGAIVDEQQLPVRIGLREHALDRLAEERLAVEERQYHGDGGSFHLLTAPAGAAASRRARLSTGRAVPTAARVPGGARRGPGARRRFL